MRALAAAAAVMLALHPGQTFRSGAEAVRVDVLVTDGNHPVGGLTAADFEVRDSGVRQRVDSVAFEDVPLNVMLALDTSDSVAGPPLLHLKTAAAAVLDLLDDQDHATCSDCGPPGPFPLGSSPASRSPRRAAPRACTTPRMRR
jgi:hypothetical protein